VHRRGHENLLTSALRGANAKHFIFAQTIVDCQAVEVDARLSFDLAGKPRINGCVLSDLTRVKVGCDAIPWKKVTDRSGRGRNLIRGFVIAGVAAGLAVHQSVFADADIHHGLAHAAELFALAAGFGHFTLRAFVSGGAGSGAHKDKILGAAALENMTLVMAGASVNRACQRWRFGSAL
jgi:hypothetical protein